MKIPRYINVQTSGYSPEWVLIDLDSITMIRKVTANCFSVSMNSGAALVLQRRQHRRLMRHMQRRHVIS